MVIKNKKDLQITNSMSKDKKEDLLIFLMQEAQKADVAKTRMRQALRNNNQEEVEEFLCPEIYTKKNNKKSWISYAKIVAPIIGCIFTIGGFFYKMQRDINLDRTHLSSQVATIEERSQRNAKVLDRIEMSTNEVSRNVSILANNITILKNDFKAQNDKLYEIDKRVFEVEKDRNL